jgi:hypothetical protein
MSQRILTPLINLSVLFVLYHAHGRTHAAFIIGPSQGFEDTSKGRLHKSK